MEKELWYINNYRENFLWLESYFKNCSENQPLFKPEFEVACYINRLLQGDITKVQLIELIELYNTTNLGAHYNGTGWTELRRYLRVLARDYNFETKVLENYNLELSLRQEPLPAYNNFESEIYALQEETSEELKPDIIILLFSRVYMWKLSASKNSKKHSVVLSNDCVEIQVIGDKSPIQLIGKLENSYFKRVNAILDKHFVYRALLISKNGKPIETVTNLLE